MEINFTDGELKKREIMEKNQKTTTIVLAIFLLVVLIGALLLINQKNTEIDSLVSENTSLDQEIMEKDSVVNDFITSFDEIESSLTFIKEKRNQLALPTDQENGKTQKEAILDDIDLMNNMLEESSEKIAELEARLRNSGISISSLEKRIESLIQDIESQNTQIAELRTLVEQKDFQIADLGNKIEDLNQTIASNLDTITYKEQVITETTDELNTGHVAYGTFKELKEMGIVSREGGLLGIGATKAIEENFDDAYFTTVDIREVSTIPLHTKKATIISEHPYNSYELVEEDDQVAYLQINNPDEFWKISKYAVIEVK